MSTAILSKSSESAAPIDGRAYARTSIIQAAFPNRAAALFAALGFASELGLAATMPGHALWSGGYASVFAVAFIAWFWLSASWLGCFLATVSSSNNTNRVVAPVVILATTLLAVGYAVSWGAYLQMGRFINWEAIRFTFINLGMLAEYIAAADVQQFFWTGLIVTSFLVATPKIFRQLRKGFWINEAKDARVKRFICWLASTVALLWVHNAVCSDISLQRRFSRLNRASECLNPALTLVTSAWNSWHEEPIEACLDTANLSPLGVEASAIPGDAATAAVTQRSVLLIAIESLRHDVVHLRHQGREVTPRLNELARQGLHLTRAYAQSTHSDYADVCLVSSLYPLRTRQHHFYRHDDPWPKTLLFDRLHRRGYATAIISSQNEAWGGMDKFLESDELDLFYDPQRSTAETLFDPSDPGFAREMRAGTLLAGKFPDRHTVDKAVEWIAQQKAAGKPFYLSTNFQSSHFPYLLPEDCPRPFQPCELAADVKFTSYSAERIPNVRNAYYNSIAEADLQVGRLLDALRGMGLLENTVVVVTGENGEGFYENGCVGHAGDPKEPAVHIAAVISAPGLIEPQVNDYPFEHVDLAPTICHLVGLDSHPNFQGMNMLSSTRPLADERLLYFHVNSPISKADAVLLAGRWKWMTSRDHPLGILYDLQTDPTESRDASDSNPELAQKLATALQLWRSRQLAYYRYPMYYSKYSPPRPPRWQELGNLPAADSR